MAAKPTKSPGRSAEARATKPASLGAKWALLVLVVAFAVRGGVAHELGQTVLYQSPQLDAMEFLDWGQRIASGDFTLPAFPTHGPGYPLFLGALLNLTDGSLGGVRLLQSALGAATCLLVALLACRLWGRLPGVLAGLVLALHGPLVMAETALWEDGLLLFLLTATLVAFDRRQARPLPATIVVGLLLGLATLVRPTPLVLLPVLLVLVFLHAQVGARHRWKHSWKAALALTLACAVVVIPAVAWVSNSVGEFLFLRGFGAINLYIGNDPAGGGLQNTRVGGAWDLLESAPQRRGVNEIGELEGVYSEMTRERIASDPAGFVGVLASKIAWLTQAEEPRDNHSYLFFRQRSKILSLLPGFGWLFALAAVGCAVAVRRRRVPSLLVAYVAVMALVVVVTLMGMRYRLPIVPALAAFAGLGLAHLGLLAQRMTQRREFRSLAVWLVAFLAVWALTHVRHHEPSHVFAEELTFTGSSLVREGRVAEAAEAFRSALEEDPSSGIAWDGLGRLHIAANEWTEAEEALGEAVRVDPNLRRAHYHRALAQQALGRTHEAITSLRRALDVAPTYTLALRELGTLLVASGDVEGAVPVLEALLEQTPDDAQALRTLAQVYGARGDAAAGLVHARRAVELSPDAETRTQSLMLLGFLAVESESAKDVRRAADSLGPMLGENDPRVRLLAGAALHLEGDPQAAQRILLPLVIEYPQNAPARQLLLKSADAAGNRQQIESYLAGG